MNWLQANWGPVSAIGWLLAGLGVLWVRLEMSKLETRMRDRCDARHEANSVVQAQVQAQVAQLTGILIAAVPETGSLRG